MTPSQLQTDDVPGALPDLDVDLGASGDPVRPVQHAFGRRGVILSAKTIRALRAGTSSSFRTAVRLACVARLRANDSSLKNRFLLHVLRLGRQLRRPAREGPNPLYHHRGLTRAMAGDLGCTRDDLSRIIRLMRADMALRAFPVWDDDLALFLSTAASFMRAHPRSAIGHAGVPDPEPDYATIRDFYVALSLRGLSTRAAWLPYELDLFFRFYATQQELGSPLTPLDRQVLAGAICHQPPTAELARMVNTHTLIDYGVGGVTLHRHILAAGSFEPIETPRRPPP